MVGPVISNQNWSQVGRTNNSVAPRNQTTPSWQTRPAFTFQPWRIPNNNFVNTQGIQNLGNMRTQASNLLAAVNDLRRPDAFNRQTITSSNTNALSVSVGNNPPAVFNTTEVTIQQLAAGQENRGTGMNATAISGFGGTHTFEIEVDGTVRTLSFNASFTDNNRTVQQRMADAINAANIGVTATIAADPATGTNALNIAARATGDVAAASFSIRDVGSGNIVDRMGVGTATRSAQEAIFTVNGEERRSNTNDVRIAGVDATLRATTTDAVTIARTTDAESGLDRVRDLVASFNSLMEIAQNSANVNPRLQQDLEGVLRSFGPGLRGLGIETNQNGRLVINENQLRQAATRVGDNPSRAESFFREFGSASFGDRVSGIANRAVNNPQHYAASPPVTGGGGGNNPWDMSQPDIFSMFAGRGNMLARVNALMNTGRLLDMFI